MEGGSRGTLGLLLATVAVPLLVLDLGIWEMARGGTGREELEAAHAALERTVTRMEAWIAAAPGRKMEVQFRRNGQLYGGPHAVQKAREVLDDAGTALWISRWRQWLPPVTVACAGLSALPSW